MNKIYFVRHAKPDFSVHDDLTRPLTDKGIIDSKKLCEFLKEKSINKIYSSPYKRSIDTIKELAQNLNIKIEVVDDFRERKISNIWIEDFNEFSKSQWENFEYKLNDGESLNEVQSRNIKALHKILNENKTFDYLSFTKIKDIMPFIVCMEFEKTNVLNIDYILEDSDSILSLN